jgi:hypothetical protein
MCDAESKVCLTAWHGVAFLHNAVVNAHSMLFGPAATPACCTRGSALWLWGEHVSVMSSMHWLQMACRTPLKITRLTLLILPANYSWGIVAGGLAPLLWHAASVHSH